MIFGRPVNLVLGAFTGIFNVIVLIATSQGSTLFTPELVAAINIAAGALITLIATQPPTVNSGDKVTVTTPSGQPNATATVGVTGAGEVTVSQ